MTHEARAIINALAEPDAAPYGARRAQVMRQTGFDTALAEIASWPGYAQTPLLSLDGLARQLGLGQLLYKDERSRFGLGSFKALGGAYAVANVLGSKVKDARALTQVSSRNVGSKFGITQFLTLNQLIIPQRMEVSRLVEPHHFYSITALIFCSADMHGLMNIAHNMDEQTEIHLLFIKR